MKLALLVDDSGITLKGLLIPWEDITSVRVETFNSNPYFILETKSEVHSFFFESKWYYRKKRPWFGASEFYTREFAKVLEEKNLFSLNKLESMVEQNSNSLFIHSIWNLFFWIFPITLFIITIIILYLGYIAG